MATSLLRDICVLDRWRFLVKMPREKDQMVDKADCTFKRSVWPLPERKFRTDAARRPGPPSPDGWSIRNHVGMTDGPQVRGKPGKRLKLSISDNPRIYLMQGSSLLYYTPEQFGGGKKVGQARYWKKQWKNSLPSNPKGHSIPNWGKGQAGVYAGRSE